MTNSSGTRSLVENHVLTEMGRLATAQYEYGDIVNSVLDLVEQIVSSPFLQLLVDEGDHVGSYHRVAQDVDVVWGEEIRYTLAGTDGQPVFPAGLQYEERRLPLLDSWAASVGAVGRSGRAAAITLAAPGPLNLAEEEIQLLSRLVQQAMLVLDHALLLARVDELRSDDMLTGLLNHTRLMETLEREITRHRYFGRVLALVMIDVDGLDAINRSYGRRYGNHVLQKLATILRDTSRPVDTVARCGLDEFAVLLPETTDDEVEQFAQALSEKLIGLDFAGGEVRVTIGMTQMRPDEHLAAEDLLRRGEQALHVSKRQSRAWAHAEQSMHPVR
jgi:diguanylate cyclase (GGDEF)-like protein